MNTLTVYYIPDLITEYEDTAYAVECFYKLNGKNTISGNPIVNPPYSNGCEFKVEKLSDIPTEYNEPIYEEKYFKVFEYPDEDDVQIISIVPNGDTKIEIKSISLNTEDKQNDFAENGSMYIEEWRLK
jgi:hypothetical protein